MQTEMIIENGTLLQLPRDIDCYGYGVDPLRSGERFVVVDEVEEVFNGVMVLAKSKAGETIRFAINTTDIDVYANTISDIGIIED